MKAKWTLKHGIVKAVERRKSVENGNEYCSVKIVSGKETVTVIGFGTLWWNLPLECALDFSGHISIGKGSTYLCLHGAKIAGTETDALCAEEKQDYE